MNFILIFFIALITFFHTFYLNVTSAIAADGKGFSQYFECLENPSRSGRFEENLFQDQQQINPLCFSQWITDLIPTPQPTTCSFFSNQHQLRFNIAYNLYNLISVLSSLNHSFNSNTDRDQRLIDRVRINSKLQLSNFWAQTYTGSDLVREYIDEKNFSINTQSPTIAVIDNYYYSKKNDISGSHGENVFHLIVGPLSSLPEKYENLVTKIQLQPEGIEERELLSNYTSTEGLSEQELNQRIQESFSFSYINTSLGINTPEDLSSNEDLDPNNNKFIAYYCSSELPTENELTYCSPDLHRLSQTLEESQLRTIWGNAAYNNHSSTNFTNANIFQPHLQSVLFASGTNPLGIISASSQHGHIAAPGDYYILSKNPAPSPDESDTPILAQLIGAEAPQGGTLTRFGGTSSTIPQVISALVAFEITSNYHPTLSEAKELLKRTGILTIHTYEQFRIKNQIKTNGTRSLNAYLLLKVAEKLKEKCHESPVRNTCFQEAIQDETTYHFSLNEDVFIDIKRRVAEIFPQCIHSEWTDIQSQDSLSQAPLSNTCENKEDLLKTIRKQALLTFNTHLWDTLSCLYDHQGLKIDAYFYKLTSRLLKNENQLKQNDTLELKRIKNQTATEIAREESFPPIMKVNSLIRLNLDENRMISLIFQIYNDNDTSTIEKLIILKALEQSGHPKSFYWNQNP